MPKPWNKKGPLLAILSRPRYETVFYRGFLGTQSAPTSLYSIEKMGFNNSSSCTLQVFWLNDSILHPENILSPCFPKVLLSLLVQGPQTWHHAIAVLKQVATLGLEANAYTCGAATSACGPLGQTVGWLFWTTFARSPKECFHVQNSISGKGQNVRLFFQKPLGHCDYCTCWLLRILISKGLGPDPTISTVSILAFQTFLASKKAIACGNRRGLLD